MNVSEKVALLVALAADFFGVGRGEILSVRKSGAIVDARHVAIYLIIQSTDLSHNAIGKMLNRDHGSVTYAKKRIENLLHHGQERRIRSAVNSITASYQKHMLESQPKRLSVPQPAIAELDRLMTQLSDWRKQWIPN